ncbi:immunoglobulin kappa light chain-like, partial [Salminus brasiliensis]|uniref:immunoglobulin kappa light chain-like n=1 Tax=Salminus brasiliensis TaxID=930266 RepID=UPI003B838DAC
YVNNGGTSKVLDANYPDREDFTITEGTYNLKVKTLKKIHSAVYYCACWDGHTYILFYNKMKTLITLYAFLFSLSTETVLGQTVQQTELSWTKPEGKSAYITCRVTGLSGGSYVHWYQQKDGEALKRILYVKKDGSSFVRDLNHPDREDFSVSTGYNDLKVHLLRKSHSAVYYCACWVGVKIFGSGTRLYVTDKKAKSPELSAYPISNKDENGKRTLLCQARGMFPDLVRFTWKDQNGKTVELSDTDDLLEQKDKGEEVRVTSMLIIDEQKASSSNYTCVVQHEDVVKNIAIPADKGQASNPGPVQTCPPKEDDHKYGSFELVRRLYPFSLTYVSLLVKNVLYFGAVCVLLYKRREGNSTPSSAPN